MSLTDKVVLIVDDEEMLHNLIQKSLADMGCRFIYASNGKDGFEKAIQLKPDLIITDLIMFEMTGMEMLRSLFERQIRIPSIMMTAYGSVRALKEANALGIYEFIEKPVKFKELRILINKILSPSEQEPAKTDVEKGLLRNVTLQIEEDLLEKIQIYCKGEGISLTTLVKGIIKTKLQEKF